MVSINETILAFIEDKGEIPDIYKNESGLADGSSIYGVVFHRKNPAVGNFSDLDFEKDNFNFNISVKNLLITGLKMKVIQIPVSYDTVKGENKYYIDSRGAVF